MGHVCAWCRKPGATQRVALDGDTSVEGYRYFCNPQHTENWNSNKPQPTPPPPLADLKTASFFDILKQANLEGWLLLGIQQPGTSWTPTTWRVNFQKVLDTGGTRDIFTDYAEHADARTAVLSALFNCRSREKHRNRQPPSRQSGTPEPAVTPKVSPLSASQERRLGRALDNLYVAVKLSGTRSRN